MAGRDALGVVGDDQHIVKAMLIEVVAIQADQHGEVLGGEQMGAQQGEFGCRVAVVLSGLGDQTFGLSGQFVLEIQLAVGEVE